MGAKITLQGVFTEDVAETIRPGMKIYHEGLLRLAETVVRPDTMVEWRHLPKYSGSLHYLYPALVNDVYIVNEVIKAENEGSDAVVLACFCDSALQACRQAVKIPVMGPGESSMLIAQLVGRKFAVVTIHPHYISQIETNILLYGWRDRAISSRPVRSIPADPFYWPFMLDAFQGKPEMIISIFEKVALECIEDGADTIICGCAPCGAALALAGYREIANTGVPLVSAAGAMFKLAEVMADLRLNLGLAKTEALVSPYQTASEQILSQVSSMCCF